MDKLNQYLEDRSQLKFVFPNSGGSQTRICPFFENPTIKEAQASVLKAYNPLGRNGSMFSYLGAKSRNINLSFNITLPHLMHMASAKVKRSVVSQEQSQATLQGLFFQQTGDGLTDVVWIDGEPTEDIQSHIAYQYNDRYLNLLDDKEQKELDFLARGLDSPLQHNNELRNDMVDIITYWVNLIRSSVLNNSENPFYGAPTIRLTHGTLYRNVPCVCSKYSITGSDKGGYDNRTLLPRIIQIKMTLQEIRVHGKNSYAPLSPVNGDNVVGWESLLDARQSFDPGEDLSIIPPENRTSFIRDEDRPV